MAPSKHRSNAANSPISSAPNRCWWCGQADDYRDYHDNEWGKPVGDDQGLFEKLCLESFQCGLSWITILRRRDVLREVFSGFEIGVVAQMTSADIDRLVKNPAIIRHRGKIEAVIANATHTREHFERPGSLAAFLWGFEPKSHVSPTCRDTVQATSPESTQMSVELKKRGFRFVGPTTCYSLMQAMGIVNDHLVDCDWHGITNDLRAQFTRPEI